MRQDDGLGPSGRLVLVVDDEEPVRQLVADVLLEAGYRVETAACVEDARAFLHDPALAVVVSDVKMPGESGLVLVEQCRARRPDVAVILMTGAAGVEERGRAARDGVPMLEKPFSFSELEAAVAAAIERPGSRP
jgi:DNA-binding NtrC family response regulator